MTIEKEKKQDIINQFRLHTTDTGSPEVQIAIITERLNSLEAHFQKHKKDHHSRRGLLKLVSQRRGLLEYLKKNNKGRYETVVKQIGLKK